MHLNYNQTYQVWSTISRSFFRSGRMLWIAKICSILFPKRVIWATVRVTFQWVRPCVVRPNFCRKNWLVRTSYILRGITLRKRWSEAFDVRDIWRVERIAATVTSDGLLKSRRIDDLMDARSRMFQALCLPIAIITLLHTSHLNIFIIRIFFTITENNIT